MRLMFAALAMSGALLGCATPPTTEAPAAAAAAPAPPPVSEAQRAMLTDFPRAPVSPPLGAGPLTTIVLASCSNEERDQPVFTRMAARKADLAILMGDNVYGSATPNDPLLSDLRAAYVRQAEREEFKALVSATPTLAIWDDHDFGKNDAGGDFPHKALAQEMFDAFWNVGADDPRAHPDGNYAAWTVGPKGQRVQILFVDTRYHRSALKPTDERGAPGKERYVPDPDPAKTMLGEAQWGWLEGELKKPAELRLLVSSVQVAAEGHGWERWGNFPHERQRLLDLIASTKAKGVLVVSGDRHYASLNRVAAPKGGYPLYDLTASAVNMPWGGGAEEKLPTLLSPAFGQENYGMIQIDWAKKALTLSILDNQDATLFSKEIAFREIRAG
jgi:alkaline phosphatase D